MSLPDFSISDARHVVWGPSASELQTLRELIAIGGKICFLVNTNTQVGRTIFVGSVDPSTLVTPRIGDVWIS